VRYAGDAFILQEREVTMERSYKSNQLYDQAFVQTETEFVKIWHSDRDLGNARPLWMVCISE
jgi:hypothetical protein